MTINEKLRLDFALQTRFVVDDAGNGRGVNSDPHAFVRACVFGFKYPSRLVVWDIGPKPLVVAVHSYLDVYVTDSEAIKMATDYMIEIGEIDGVLKPDFVD